MRKCTPIQIFKLVLAAFLTASLLCNLQVLWGKRSYIAKGYFDFVIYYTGAEIVNAGRGNDLYNLKVQEAYQEKFKVRHQPWSVLPFNHAPYELLLFSPLAALPFQTAHILWSLLSIVFLVVTWRILVRFIDEEHKYLAAALLIAFYPTTTTLQMGQDSTLSLLILTGVYAGLKRDKEFLAGGILALGLYKPQLVLPLAGALTIERRWRAIWGFIAIAGVLFLISFAMVGSLGVLGLAKIISSMRDPTSIVDPDSMTNLRGLSFVILNLFDSKALTNVVTCIASIITYGLCLWLWQKKAKSDSSTFDLRYSLAIVTTVLISFHLYAHDAIILTVGLIILVNHALKDRAQLSVIELGSLVFVLVLFTPFVPFFLTVEGGLGWAALPILLIFVLNAYEIVSFMTRRSSAHFVQSTRYNEAV